MKDSLKTIAQALRLYSPEEIYMSLNGGKDSSVILHLVGAALCSAAPAAFELKDNSPFPVSVVNFDDCDSFPEESEFFAVMCRRCRLKAMIAGANMKSEIERMQLSQQPCKAFIMGTRRTDPHGATLQRFEPSSLSWPSFMRVCPILEWRLADVWEFMRTYGLPYCPLYDRGYASLGSRATTSICPALVREDGSFVPAFLLADQAFGDLNDRVGRFCEAPAPPSAARTGASS